MIYVELYTEHWRLACVAALNQTSQLASVSSDERTEGTLEWFDESMLL